MGIYNDFSKEKIDQINEGNIVKTVTNVADLFKQWKDVTKKFAEKQWVYRFIKDDAQKEMLKKHYENLVKEDISYGDYKKEFRFFCSFFGLDPKDIIIEHIKFESADKVNKERIGLRYSQGRVKVKIPEDIYLIHMSPAKDIKELKPTFRGKTKGEFMYSSKRVYFTVLKPVSKFTAGTNQKLTKYTPKQHIEYAYIDPACIHFFDNCVFVETDNPIPVEGATEKFEKELKESFVEEEVLSETVLKDFIDSIKKWKTENKDHSIQKYKTDLTDEEKDKVKDMIKGMKEAKNFEAYRKYFDQFCRFCHIKPEGTIITKYDIKGNELNVEYSFNNKKIKLPDDLALYHLSRVGGIKKLMPQFKGKADRGYLYDRPRVYFTINKYMPKFLADYKPSEKMHKYRCKENIKDVYVDPLVWNYFQGAVYVNTNKDIPVEEMKPGLLESYIDYMVECNIEIIEE